MRPEDLREFTRRQPFEPFCIHITGGKTYDIRHPAQVIVLRSRLVIGVGGDNSIADSTEHIALIHIVRITL
jgi:hypothetical protein